MQAVRAVKGVCVEENLCGKVKGHFMLQPIPDSLLIVPCEIYTVQLKFYAVIYPSVSPCFASMKHFLSFYHKMQKTPQGGGQGGHTHAG